MAVSGAADCVFCLIAAHEAPATIRFEDPDVVAFDAEPGATPLHVLVVPRRHVRSVAELDDVDLAGRLVLAAARVAREAGVTTSDSRRTQARPFRTSSICIGT
jgi:histidine triad (HIT) family protein